MDAHVHLFPDRLFAAIWRWFDAHAWPIRYRLPAEAVIDFLLSRGVRHLVALTYAHKPGMARELNAWLAALVRDRPRVTGAATVFPGEPDAPAILEEAFESGLQAVKLHCHVQCFAPDEDRLGEIYETCVAYHRPLVMHAGREPKSPAYACDPHALCSADRIERVLRDHPRLRLCVPHLGGDEFDAYAAMLERHDNLWVDTTMVVGDFLPMPRPDAMIAARPDRVMYGTDFPNIPYAWDRELRALAGLGLPEADLARVLGGTAAELFEISLAS